MSSINITEDVLNILNKRVDAAIKHFPELRYGQALFNEALDMFPEVVNEIRGTDDDCFYDDKKVSAFLNHFKVLRNDTN